MSSPQRKNLIENSNVGLTKKLLTASLGALIVGKQSDIRVRGTKNEMAVISRALLSSKKLHEELKSSEATVESVMRKLKLKQESALEFEKVFGMPWPL